MESHQPIKRSESLKNLSREHHFGLLLCWKIKEGLKRADHQRVKQYVDYFFKEYLEPHFRIEEKYVFPLLGEEHSMVQTAIEDHRKLRSLFAENDKVLESLQDIENTLEKHIRFEERVLFKELQRVVPEDSLQKTLAVHDHSPAEDNWPDKFWEQNS